ncbi:MULTISPECIES: YlxM family DNA-binding protein [Anaerococcus]|nr:sigma factor-like helix-turn-helix DNA-binding protein [Anaerococcus vaginalis]MDU4447438.1 sigma factor-like helix-turn-helix DNA-binding protein [Anaerococcus vaginalis]MDU5342761.1 sigma factor-like helix-turn-helix DNA-binding protein [Anaerococcus vaginalis]MDU5374129.1 sigma factor-like helix-turn-helix DNA-binding protein [Anaerococcus vaginalis]MDU5560857.1 sigma factor-like helix-turn-helix DNA-binding protein [Anaerococcus vaginalis]MDU6546845.1 sigma factor-like helix-turn-helix 
MEKLVQVARLFDTYGSLLNEKQKDVINCYYNEDLSLNEIAQNNNKSKQAISDMIQRSVDKLFEFENELSLIKKKNQLREDLSLLRELIESSNQSEAMDMIDEMINKI